MKTRSLYSRVIHSTWFVYAIGLVVIALQLRALL